MAETKPDVNSGLSWLEKILQLYKEYGIIGILKGAFTLVIFSITLQICYNPGYLFDKYTEYQQQKHTRELLQRSEYDFQLKNLLPMYLYKYRADRVWVIQYHNGTMDWQHGTMRFELCNKNIHSVKNQYNDFNLTWLNLPYYLQENEIFIGDLDQLNEIDHVLCSQLEKNEVKYLACTLVRDNSGYPIGVFGVTWNELPQCITIDQMHDYLIEDRSTVRSLIQTKTDKK